MDRVTRRKRIGNYFETEDSLEFVSTGCTILNCILGGGYPIGRIVNIVGDKSTGKTLLAIEAIINFLLKYPKAKVRYHEVEAAFDKGYARNLGLPVDNVEFIEDIFTVEGLFGKLTEVTKVKEGPNLYILDSLDALSDEAELDRDIDKGSFGAAKAKKMSETFRRLTSKVKKSQTLFIVISQVRENIGVMFGEKYTRSGGKALDFYASQAVWLSEVQKIKKTIRKVQRVIGIQVKAKCKKNKAGIPFRECLFPIFFGYGVDDIAASLNWLKEVDGLGELKVEPKIENFHPPGNEENREMLEKLVVDTWNSIEKEFLPKRKKYI